MKRRKSTVLTSLIVTIAMVMSMGGYLFADETETEVVPEEPAVEETAEAPEDIEEPEVTETEEEEEAPAEASENETSDEDVPVEESAEEAPVADEIAEEELFTGERVYSFDSEYDNDELAEQYILSQMTVGHQASSARYDCQTNLNDNELIAYNTIYPEIRLIASGDRSDTRIAMPESLIINFTAEELGLQDLSNKNEVSEALDLKIDDRLNVSSIMHSLLSACPYELYWFNKTATVSGGGLNIGYSYYILSDHVEVINFAFYFSVAQEYQLNGQAYVFNTAKYGSLVEPATRNARSIINRYSGLDDYNKLLAYNNQICLLTDYNTDAADSSTNTPYGNPWQLVWVFDGDPGTTVVCEGYSKAFQFLCDNSVFRSQDIYAISVRGVLQSGNSSGRHMWNIVHMDDGKNYLVDVTNSDPQDGSGTAGDRLFMVGATALPEPNVGWYLVDLGEGYDPSYVLYHYDSDLTNIYSASALELSSTDYVYGSTQALPTFCGHALALSGQIGLQFFVELPDGADPDNYYVAFSDENGHVNRYREYNLSVSNKVDSSNIYMIQLNLSSIQMAERISPVLCNRTTGIEVFGDSYSVQDYINWGISPTNTVTTPAEKTLLIALANYGYRAQRYLSTVQGHEWTLGVDYSEMTLDNPTIYDYEDIKMKTQNYAISSSNTDQYFSRVTFALKFGDQVSLILYFASSDDIDPTGFTVNGRQVTPVLQADGRYRITIPSISVTDIGNVFTVRYDQACVNVSPLSYIYAMLNRDDSPENGMNFVCALFDLAVACGMRLPTT